MALVTPHCDVLPSLHSMAEAALGSQRLQLSSLKHAGPEVSPWPGGSSGALGERSEQLVLADSGDTSSKPLA